MDEKCEHILVLQAGEVPRYDCSSEEPLDARDAERRVEERLDSSSKSGGVADLGTPLTKYVISTFRRPRPRCFNCGSYYHALKVSAEIGT